MSARLSLVSMWKSSIIPFVAALKPGVCGERINWKIVSTYEPNQHAVPNIGALVALVVSTEYSAYTATWLVGLRNIPSTRGRALVSCSSPRERCCPETRKAVQLS
eukprot:1190363-Prorocentrum_minimum.AAC.1